MEFKCDYCNKIYKSYQSRWNHIKKYHNSDVNIVNNNVNKNVYNLENVNNFVNNVNNKTGCKYCNKSFSTRQSKSRHENYFCKNINSEENNEIHIIKNQMEELKKAHNNEINELKNMLQKALKIHPKTLQKINNQLNATNMNNGTINNITNTQIFQIGNENLNDVLTQKQKLKILNRQAMSLNEIVDMVHVSNNYNQFKNVYVTNLQSSFCYKYDDNTKTFIAVNKNELLDELVDARMYDINTFYEELQHLMSPEKADQLKKFIERMDNGDDNLKGIKKEEIKLILYNKRNKVKPLYEESTNTLEL